MFLRKEWLFRYDSIVQQLPFRPLLPLPTLRPLSSLRPLRPLRPLEFDKNTNTVVVNLQPLAHNRIEGLKYHQAQLFHSSKKKDKVHILILYFP